MAPVHIFQGNGGSVELYQSNYGLAENREDGGFVNNAVSYVAFPFPISQSELIFTG